MVNTSDIYLQKLEKAIIPKCPKIVFWKRYVDDVFAVINGDENDAEEIRQTLNTYHNQIQFTMEKETNGEIPFLDILIRRNSLGNIETKVYRKDTHTDRYLNYNSFHHTSQKISVGDALVFRAFKICSHIHLEAELNHITNVLMQNNYPIGFINKRISRMRSKFQSNESTTFGRNSETNEETRTLLNNHIIINQNLTVTDPREDETDEEREHWVPLPYIGSISNKVGGFLRNKLKWKVTFTPGIKIQNMLNGIKDKEDKELAGIYNIPCSSCDQNYLGESKRVVRRLEDHKGNVRRREYNKSAVARHTIRNRGHEINWNDSKLIMKESNHHLRAIKEGLAIQQHPGPLMNLDKGLVLSNAWKPIVPKITDFKQKQTPIPQ